MDANQEILKKIESLLDFLIKVSKYEDEQELLNEVALSIASVGYENVMISLLFDDEMPKKIKAVIAFGSSWDSIKDETVRSYPGEDVLAKVLQRKQSKYIPDCKIDPECNQEAIDISRIKSQYIVPLYIDDLLIGTMQIHMKDSDHKPELECKILDVLGVQISLSIYRIRTILSLIEANDQIMSFSKAALANFLSSEILHQSRHEIDKINAKIDDIQRIKQVNSIVILRKSICALKDELNQLNNKFKETLIFNKLKEKVGNWSAKDIVQETINYWYKDAKLKNCDISGEFVEKNLNIEIIRSELKEALSCLIINSLQAHAKRIKIVVEHIKEKIGGDYPEDACIIRIKDNGNGISVEEAKEIFKFGYSTKNKTGTGLGLTIVKNFVENMEGLFILEQCGKKSGFNETIFKIILPCKIL